MQIDPWKYGDSRPRFFVSYKVSISFLLSIFFGCIPIYGTLLSNFIAFFARNRVPGEEAVLILVVMDLDLFKALI